MDLAERGGVRRDVMKIALFCPSYPPSCHEGGVSHYTQILCRHLSGPGREIFVVTDEAYRGDGNDGAVRVLKFHGPWTHVVRKRISKVLRSCGVDMINLQYSPPMYEPGFRMAWSWMARQFASCVSFHTLWGGSRINYAAALSLLCGADGIIATNSEIMYLLKRYLHPFLRKTKNIPIGANIEPEGTVGAFDKAARQYGLDPKIPVLAYFGMSYPGKGMTNLFEATRILLARGHQIQLLVIGGGISDVPEYIEEKRRLTSRLGIEGRVIWTGRIPAKDVSALLEGSRLALLPYDSGVSDRRGSLMAALAHGKAVLTTRPAVPVALFKNRENMIWPETVEAAALAEVVSELLEDRELLGRLERGAKELAKHYQWPGIASQTKDFFQEIVARKRGSLS